MATASSGGSLIGKIGSYLQIFAKDPSSTAFVPLAEAYRQIGLLDDALEAARLGTNMLPHFSPGFSTMGRILGQMGRLDEAMSAYAKALSIDRQSQAALVGLARLHLIRAERDTAKKILQQAAEFHPDDVKISDMLNALSLPRPWDEIKQATKIQEPAAPLEAPLDNPAEPIPTATLAEIYVKQGLIDQAIKIYRDILKQTPDNNAAQNRMAQLQEQLGVKFEIVESELPPEIDTPAVQQTSAEIVEQVVSAAPESSPEIQSVPNDQSPLTIFKSWLTAIKLRRTNV